MKQVPKHEEELMYCRRRDLSRMFKYPVHWIGFRLKMQLLSKHLLAFCYLSWLVVTWCFRPLIPCVSNQYAASEPPVSSG